MLPPRHLLAPNLSWSLRNQIHHAFTKCGCNSTKRSGGFLLYCYTSVTLPTAFEQTLMASYIKIVWNIINPKRYLFQLGPEMFCTKSGDNCLKYVGWRRGNRLSGYIVPHRIQKYFFLVLTVQKLQTELQRLVL